MAVFIFLAIAVALVGALAAAFGSDSRAVVEDTHREHGAWRSI